MGKIIIRNLELKGNDVSDRCLISELITSGKEVVFERCILRGWNCTDSHQEALFDWIIAHHETAYQPEQPIEQKTLSAGLSIFIIIVMFLAILPGFVSVGGKLLTWYITLF